MVRTIRTLTTCSLRDHKATANIAQIKARLSEYLRQVKGGSEVVITERGIPVARLVPLAPDERRATREERLIRSGALRPPAGPRQQLGSPKGKPGAGRDVLDILIADRGEGR